MKNVDEWNDEYGLYHKNKINKVIHWICVPLIMFSLLGLLSLLNFEFKIEDATYKINILAIFIIFTLLFYIRLSKSLTLGMLLISLFFPSFKTISQIKCSLSFTSSREIFALTIPKSGIFKPFSTF